MAVIRQLRGPRRLRRGLGCRGFGWRFCEGRGSLLFVWGPDSDARCLRAVRQGSADGRRVRGLGQVGDAVSSVWILGFELFSFSSECCEEGRRGKTHTHFSLTFLSPFLSLFLKNKKSKTGSAAPPRRGPSTSAPSRSSARARATPTELPLLAKGPSKGARRRSRATASLSSTKTTPRPRQQRKAPRLPPPPPSRTPPGSTWRLRPSRPWRESPSAPGQSTATRSTKP